MNEVWNLAYDLHETKMAGASAIPQMVLGANNAIQR